MLLDLPAARLVIRSLAGREPGGIIHLGVMELFGALRDVCGQERFLGQIKGSVEGRQEELTETPFC